MDLIAELRKALGLPATADEGAVVSAVQASVAQVTAHAAKLSELNGQVTSLQAASTDAGTLRGEVTRLTTELHTIKQDSARQTATLYVEKAMADGKPINPTLKDHYITRHMADPEAVEKEIGAMVSLNDGGVHTPRPPELHADDGAGLSEMEKAICARMGLDPKKFAAEKKKGVK